MLLFYFWVALIIAAVVAVPVAVKMTPGPARPASEADDLESMDDYEQSEGEDPAMAVAATDDGFGGDDIGAEPLGDDAFADFN